MHYDEMSATFAVESVQCNDKWFTSLAPSLVDRGEWDLKQDKQLVAALAAALEEGTAEWDIDWDNLVPGRAMEQVWLCVYVGLHIAGEGGVWPCQGCSFVTASWWTVLKVGGLQHCEQHICRATVDSVRGL